MRHVPAHLWSALETVSASRRRAFTRHAEGCPRCARTRDRVAELSDVFTEIRDAPAPELEWDHVGARIHWSRSLERRTGERPAVGREIGEVTFDGERARRWPWALVTSAGLLAGAALAFYWFRAPIAPSASNLTPAPVESLAALPVELADGAELEALIVLARGEVLVDGAAADWRAALGVGQRISTGEGEVVVQFARGGGFALGPNSATTLRSFDTYSVELVLEGTLEVNVSRRAANQQFVVVAGERTVSVRGTAFRVRHRDGDVEVACEHGRVEVADGVGMVAVAGSEQLIVGKSADLSDGATALELSPAEHAALAADLAMPLLGAWRDAKAMLEATSVISILAGEGAAVSVDGAVVGKGAMQMRLFAGRHEVAVEGGGAWAGGRWIDLEGGPEEVRIVHAGSTDRASGSQRVRRVQLRLALRENPARLRRCVARLEAAGVSRGAFVALRVAVNDDGTLGAVNASDSNVDLDTRRCVLDAVGGLTLPVGSPGTVEVRWEP